MDFIKDLFTGIYLSIMLGYYKTATPILKLYIKYLDWRLRK